MHARPPEVPICAARTRRAGRGARVDVGAERIAALLTLCSAPAPGVASLPAVLARVVAASGRRTTLPTEGLFGGSRDHRLDLLSID